MPLYRFYRIVSTEGPEEYIGSTTQTLSERLYGHKADYNRSRKTSSCILFAKYGVESCSITLISEQEMEKVDAMREERKLIEECSLAINQVKPIRKKDDEKNWSRKYREKHHEEIIERVRKYREEHRESIKAKQTEKIPCDVCGKLSARGGMARHKKSKSCLSKKIDE